MTKQQLVEKIAEKSGLTKADAARAVDSFTEVITESLANKEKVSLIGFGTFGVSERKASEGRNPRTGEKVSIAAKTVPTFKAGSKLKEAVNK